MKSCTSILRHLSASSRNQFVSRRQQQYQLASFYRFLSTSKQTPNDDGDVDDTARSDRRSPTDDDHDHVDSSSLPIFPWRHETEPLPRLLEGTPEYKSLGPMLTSVRKLMPGNAKLNSAATAFMFLDIPWYKMFWLSQFEEDLAENISWAFTQGVGELLWLLPLPSSASSSTNNKNTSPHNSPKDGTIDFHQTINLIQSAAASVDVVGKSTDEQISLNSSKEHLQSTLKSMFQNKILQYYQSAKDNALASLLTGSGVTFSTERPIDGESDNTSPSTNVEDEDISTSSTSSDEEIEIRLQMEPYQSKLVSLYSIPYMSRELADNDPSYLAFYRNMLSKPRAERTPDLSRLRMEYLDGYGRMESTVIAQALVWCNEIFYVKHLPSGRILQGQEAFYTPGNSRSNSSEEDVSNESKMRVSQLVPHLVRMEMTVVTTKDPISGQFANDQGDWIITDIDDKLGGNFVV